MVRAKFRCVENSEVPGQTGATIVLEPVTSGSEENRQFFSFTPWGRVELGTVNPDASGQFEVGGEYYIDFTRA